MVEWRRRPGYRPRMLHPSLHSLCTLDANGRVLKQTNAELAVTLTLRLPQMCCGIHHPSSRTTEAVVVQRLRHAYFTAASNVLWDPSPVLEDYAGVGTLLHAAFFNAQRAGFQTIRCVGHQPQNIVLLWEDSAISPAWCLASSEASLAV